MNRAVHCLPFDLELEAFAEHQGLSRCSATAQALWLSILEEAFCSGSLRLRVLDAIVARLGLEEESLYPQLDELVTWRVFAVTANGKIQPIDADYLHTDFWARLRERAA